jgi:hypothetical protein
MTAHPFFNALDKGLVYAGTEHMQRAEVERVEAEARHAHRLRLPRRPAWDEGTTPEQLDAQVPECLFLGRV